MNLTREQFTHIFPKVDPDVCDLLNTTMDDYEISESVARMAGFLAQVGHESLDLTRLVENLNYSADGLAKTWPSRYRGPDGKPNALAYKIQRKPEAIANNCYANRMGNGNEASGDGWKYRGRGAFMTTGLSNYVDTQRATGLLVVENPDLLQQPANALEAAGWFWNRYALNRRMDAGDFKGTTQIINGGQIGADDRNARYQRLTKYLTGSV
jgi:putative chitinase